MRGSALYGLNYLHRHRRAAKAEDRQIIAPSPIPSITPDRLIVLVGLDLFVDHYHIPNSSISIDS